jgi:peptide/nickel transport system permease protein
MLTYLLRRTVGAIVTILVIATIVFLLLRVTTDPASALVTAEATQEQIAAVRTRLGVDKPIPVQYVDFLSGIVTGRMSPSYRSSQPAMQLVLERVPATFTLAATALALALLIAFPLGVLSAVYQNSIIDYAASFIAFLGFAVPAFWLGSMLVIIFGVQLRAFPTSGSGTPEHLILPTLTLAMWPLGQLTRLIRSELLNVLSDDYVRTARAKGLRESVVVVRHALRNALLPVVTLIGLLVGGLLSGAVVTETIFAWPGIGRLALEATLNRDLPLIEASVVLIAIIFVGINLLVDLLYAVIDPRIEL